MNMPVGGNLFALEVACREMVRPAQTIRGVSEEQYGLVERQVQLQAPELRTGAWVPTFSTF
jgi:hypothetical protein